ncbi:MAG: phosphoribosylformylglycinamidine synthase subunit PurL [Natronomonas sp.]|uniref:phosphoribosylformylglycinamidine synthase subunit PurL n=1 Tax=Natronomonas sp. TaxID=2184060 RepID=UPI00287053B3|nr:phosphoribosylformylglycinamidine synthase subunit PurL [Natronomonas sp.]MDR9382187.1 phosphoribosylformylglycinamidine synthase subunit PurL [Natronomonas sp.]MDR9431173.1 phosphoribosylformylglycinamidine synthase subunit PurL [Natronomonas sp.]
MREKGAYNCMSLPPSDRKLVVEALGRDPTPAEVALFENLWSEHCAYRSSRPLLSAFESESDRVVIGPGDDAAVVALPDPETGENSDTYVTMGIESHNHPSYVDPFDGAATGVGGIVRDTLSMGAYPIALADSLYFGAFDHEHSKYLLDGVVEGISHYGNCIGVPTVTGSVAFHDGYEGNPLVNVACIGLTNEERLVTAEAQTPGNELVLVGNATGRDGLGGASFASEDLAEDAETEDRPAVQVGDPYAEKRLIEANEELIDADLVRSARDLGAAGLGGASSELVAKGGLGAHIELDRVHQREPNMNATEILLAESQERMCYEVRPEDVEAVEAIAEKYDLGCSVIGEVTEGNYVCTFGGSETQGVSDEPSGGEPRGRDTVVDCDAEYLADGAPMNDLDHTEPLAQDRDLPSPDLTDGFEAVVGSPNTASKEWVYRQYDHEVGTRTAVKPGDDAALLAVREVGVGLAFASGADPNWTATAPYEGARAVALENAINLATTGATPLAAVDCLNGGNPEKSDVYGGFRAIVDGLADMCSELGVPVVGGNVSLYNDSVAGPIPPTPTLAMAGTKAGYDAPGIDLDGGGDLLLVGGQASSLGGSELLAQFGGTDRFPAVPERAADLVAAIAAIANDERTLSVHDVSHGGLAVTLAEMIGTAGAAVELPGASPLEALFSEASGRVVVETTDLDAVRELAGDVATVERIGESTGAGRLDCTVGDETLSYTAAEIEALRDALTSGLE